jgi:hypothetical protein
MMTIGSNSQPKIETLVARCKESLERARESGLASLQAFRDAGAALRQIKGIVPRGKFGAIAQQLCGCSKQWRARLLELDRDWGDVQTSLEWAKGHGRELGRRAYSVDGALALLKEWRRSQHTAARPTARATRSHPAGTEALVREIAELKSENAALKNRLSVAKAYSVALEGQLAALQSSMPATQPLDDRTRDKVRKVAELWHRGGTDGERASAVNQLVTVADRLGRTLPILRRECSIESPADWTCTPS